MSNNIEVLADEAVKSIKGYIGRQLAEVSARISAEIAQVEQRLAHIENRPQLRYLGVFEQGHSYVRGDVVTWSGSMWFCNQPTSDKPGDGQSIWTLCVKRGRDAK